MFTNEHGISIKDYLKYQGISDIVGSRDALRVAFKMNLIKNGQVWMDMPIPYMVDVSIFDCLNHVELKDHIERVGKLFYERKRD